MNTVFKITIGFGTAAILIHGWRQFIGGGVCYSKARLDGRTVIVTGSNTGIGKETARDLARRGARVILACRNISKAEVALEDIKTSTANENVVVRKLDLSSLASVREFATLIQEEEERLDILINNAGVAFNPRTETEDGFEMTLGTNHFGHFLLTNLLLDLLKKSAPSRVVNVSSDAYRFASKGMRFDDLHLKEIFDGWFAYGQRTSVTTYAVHPGAINSELDRHAHKGLPLPIISVRAIRFVMWLLGKTPIQGAQTSIYCAVEESIATTSGKYFKDCAPTKLADFAEDQDSARRLWELSVKAVGLERVN